MRTAHVTRRKGFTPSCARCCALEAHPKTKTAPKKAHRRKRIWKSPEERKGKADGTMTYGRPSRD